MPQTKPPLPEKVRRFLRTPRIARLATIGVDGYPHIVPLYFMLDGDDILFGSDRNERKVRNAAANPKGTVVIGGDPGADEAGYMIHGDLIIEEDAQHCRMRRMLRRYETREDADMLAAERAEPDMVIIRLKPSAISDEAF